MARRGWSARLLSLLVAFGACRGDGRPDPHGVSVPVLGEGALDAAAIERGRMDPTWRVWADRDRAARAPHASYVRPAAPPAEPAPRLPAERYADIRPALVLRPPRLPVPRTAGPSVLHVQVLLDRARFSPGVIDGHWGKNTAKAVYWFQYRYGLPPTGTVDSSTYARLEAVAGGGAPLARYRITAADVDGPFTDVPSDIYAQAELDCLCYESPGERLAERFHTTPAMLAQLNPGVDPGRLRAGAVLWVPDIRRARPDTLPDVARIVISKNGFYTQALDADGNILYHFPSTLGSRYAPSPRGEFHVTDITGSPHFLFQPELFHEVPDDRSEAVLPPGPNSPVGVVWIGLSQPHYGIHGTAEPETIGYATSHGCVRLTNWDAQVLARHAREGTPVEFR
ncbi:MAG TPA: L,D-transpeptidase [Longimicrobiales bacterium]